MTRTKQCEVVLKISTDTLRKKGEKSMLNKDKSDNFFFAHITHNFIFSISRTLAPGELSVMAESAFKSLHDRITSH